MISVERDRKGHTTAEMQRAVVDLYKQKSPESDSQTLARVNHAVHSSIRTARRNISEPLVSVRVGREFEYDENSSKEIFDELRRTAAAAKKGVRVRVFNYTPRHILREQDITPELIDKAWENLFPSSKSEA